MLIIKPWTYYPHPPRHGFFDHHRCEFRNRFFQHQVIQNLHVLPTLGSVFLLVGGWTNPSEKYARQIGPLPKVGVKIKNIWNHRLVYNWVISPAKRNWDMFDLKSTLPSFHWWKLAISARHHSWKFQGPTHPMPFLTQGSKGFWEGQWWTMWELRVGGWTTHFQKNMLVKLDHFPKDQGEHKKYLKPPPRLWLNHLRL